MSINLFQRYNPILFLFIAIGVLAGIGIIILADFSQTSSNTTIILGILSAIFFLLYFVFFEISVQSLLYLSPFLFLYPLMIVNFAYSVALLIVFVLQSVHQAKYRFHIPYLLFFLLLLVAGFRSYFAGLRGPIAFTMFQTECLLPFLLFFVVTNSQFSKKQIIAICTGHVFLASFLAIIGIILAILNPNDRLGSIWSNAMTINGYYVMAFFTGIGLMNAIPKWNKLFFALSIVILFGMIFTYTRIVLVGVLVGVLIMGLRHPRVLIYGALSLLVVPFLLPSGLMDRVQNTQGDMSLLIRFIAWFYSLQIFQSNPIWGLGFDSFVLKFKNFIPVKNLYAIHSHCIYLRLLVEMGAVGFIGYMGVVVSNLIRPIRTIKRTEKFSLLFMLWIAIISELVFCLTDVFISQLSVSFYFWLLLAFIYKMSTESEILYELDKKAVDETSYSPVS